MDPVIPLEVYCPSHIEANMLSGQRFHYDI